MATSTRSSRSGVIIKVRVLSLRSRRLRGPVKIVVRRLERLHRTDGPRLMGAFARPTLGTYPASGSYRNARPVRKDDRPPRDRPDDPLRPSDDGLNSMRPWNLSETNYGTGQATGPFEVAVLPLGATEPHNLHLPYGTDTYQVEVVGRSRLREGPRSKGRGSPSCPRSPTGPRPTRCDSRWP